jgi:predicted NUDIX family NTP pyrophosphohydrolase
MSRADKSGIVSAGILLFRLRDGLEILLAHQGGPFWKSRDLGHWTIPKGEAEPAEALFDVARREFAEETGTQLVASDDLPLGEITQKSGKVVVAWAVEGDLDPALAHSNTFSIEWPPKSGQVQAFPEIDRVEWFVAEEARRRLKAAQVPFIDRLVAALDR